MTEICHIEMICIGELPKFISERPYKYLTFSGFCQKWTRLESSLQLGARPKTVANVTHTTMLPGQTLIPQHGMYPGQQMGQMGQPGFNQQQGMGGQPEGGPTSVCSVKRRERKV